MLEEKSYRSQRSYGFMPPEVLEAEKLTSLANASRIARAPRAVETPLLINADRAHLT